MCVDKVHQLINFFSDPDLLICLHCQSLFDLVHMPILGLIEGVIHMINDLFSQILEIIVEFLEGIICLFFFTFEH